jgi:hypothetical protein
MNSKEGFTTAFFFYDVMDTVNIPGLSESIQYDCYVAALNPTTQHPPERSLRRFLMRATSAL